MTRSAEDRVAVAIDLGWRMAELCALNVEYDEPRERTCDLLPSRNSFSRHDRLELEVLAAAGAVRRLGIGLPEEQLDQVRALAERAAADKGARAEFRDQLERCHVALNKQLWMRDEAEGRAYELGITLSDTYNRIFRAYQGDEQTPRDEWQAVFDEARITALNKHLDNLQSRLDPGAVAVVRDHLKAWEERVQNALAAGYDVPSADDSMQLRRQTAVWRQLLTGDKQPEAFLETDARARVRDELVRVMMHRYWKAVAGLFVLLFGASATLLLMHLDVGDWYSKHTREAALVTSFVLSAAGALGISKASINRVIKENVRTWSMLLWNQALADVVCTETLYVDRVFPKTPSLSKHVVYACRHRIGSALSVSAKSTPNAPSRAGV